MNPKHSTCKMSTLQHTAAVAIPMTDQQLTSPTSLINLEEAAHILILITAIGEQKIFSKQQLCSCDTFLCQ
jgi:hypothetical protein